MVDATAAPFVDHRPNLRANSLAGVIAIAGVLNPAEARALHESLMRGPNPTNLLPDVPWATVVQSDDQRVRASCSTMWVSGLFYAVVDAGRRLVVATDARSVANSTGAHIDTDYLVQFATGHAPVHATPYAGVRRIPPGCTLEWLTGSRDGTLHTWCGPETLPQPHLDDPEEIRSLYLNTFDTVVAQLASRTSPLVATLSGGLDSTFMVASLARGDDREILGLCHSPLPQAHAQHSGGFDPDDLPLAEEMAAMYPGQLKVRALRNTTLIHPLDAAAKVSERTGWPNSAPPNAVWLEEFDTIARSHSARLKFFGGQGNAAFSYDHPYAARYYARRPWRLASLARGRSERTSYFTAVRRRIVRPLRPQPLRQQRPPFLPARPTTDTRHHNKRVEYLRWLCGQRSGLPAAFSPGDAQAPLVADPFTARSMIELAAAIEPRQWQLGDDSRSLARNLARGRVPESIRTRRTRGGQGFDAWYVVAQRPARLTLALELMADSPVWRDVIDIDGMINWYRTALSAGPTAEVPSGTLNVVLRLAAAAEFAERHRENTT